MLDEFLNEEDREKELLKIIAVNNRYEVFENSDDWKMVEFHLKSSIPHEIKIDKIISVKNTLTYNQFEFLADDLLWSYGWYNLKGNDYDISMKEMRERSFKIPEQGANFKVGAIFDSSNSAEVQSVYVLCKIIIGKSFCRLKQEGEKEDPPEELEEPYESYMYCNPEQSAKSQKMSWSMTKPYSYYIKNRNYIEPLYTVFFSQVSSFETNLKSKFMCVQCKVKEATIYCSKCVNYYCNECKSVIHSGNVSENNEKNLFQHKDFFVELTFTTRPGKCALHRDKDSEYYCDTCKRAICGYCRFKGAHSKGLQSSHQLDDIYSYFQKTRGQAQNQEFEDKKTSAIDVVKKITEKITGVDSKMEAHKKEIDEDFDNHKTNIKETCKQVKLEVFEYIQALREIKRNMIYFKNYFTEREKYLKEQKNYPELAFIWSMHQEIIKEYLRNIEELKKMDFEQYSEKLDISMPKVTILKENFGFNKTKVQIEISNKRSTQKNDDFDQRQKEENYDVNIDKTRELAKNMRKNKKKERENNTDGEQMKNEKRSNNDELYTVNTDTYKNSSADAPKRNKSSNDNDSEAEATTFHSGLKYRGSNN